MTPYQILVEGVFVKTLGAGDSTFGFHTTFYVMANNAANAVHRVAPMLENRIAAHGFATIEHGASRTYCFVRDIWEVTGEKLSQNDGKDLGFSFFEIGSIEKGYLMFRRAFFKRFKPWLMIGDTSKNS